MIRRLRWKVVGLNMGMVFCVLLAVFAAVFFFARSALSRSLPLKCLHSLNARRLCF